MLTAVVTTAGHVVTQLEKRLCFLLRGYGGKIGLSVYKNQDIKAVICRVLQKKMIRHDSSKRGKGFREMTKFCNSVYLQKLQRWSQLGKEYKLYIQT